jgi:Tol biopolymer transport system component
MGKPAWLGNGKAIAAAAAGGGSSRGQIVQVGWPRGDVSELSHDTADYRDLSGTRDSGQLVTTQLDRQSSIWMAQLQEPDKAQAVISGGRFYGLSWTPAGKLLSQTNTNEQTAFWLVDPRSGEQQLVMQGQHAERDAVVSPDGRYLVFVSNRGGTFHIWRSNADASHAARLTLGPATESAPAITPDGKWVVYTSVGTGYSLWQAAMQGGKPFQIADHDARKATISPDGRLLVCEYYDDPSLKWTIAVLELATGKLVRTFPQIPAGDNAALVHWSPDGRDLFYSVADANEVSNVWAQRFEGGAPRKLTHFADDHIFALAPSPDGKSLALVRGRTSSDVVLMQAKNSY